MGNAPLSEDRREEANPQGFASFFRGGEENCVAFRWFARGHSCYCILILWVRGYVISSNRPPLKTIKQLLKIDQRQIFANQRQMPARCWFVCGGMGAL